MKSASNYPVTKILRHGPEEQTSSALAERANALVKTGNTEATAKAHDRLASDHLALSATLRGEGEGHAAQAHAVAAQAHKDASDAIRGISPSDPKSLSIAESALGADRAKGFTRRAANFSNGALQATTNVALTKATQDINALNAEAPHAQEIADRHVADWKDYKAISGAHLAMGIRHHDLAEACAQRASIARSNNGNQDNADSRAWNDAYHAQRDAMEAHYTAARRNENNAYANDKIEGAVPNIKPSAGNAHYASKVAAMASEKADALTARATEFGYKKAVTFSTAGRWTDQDPTAKNLKALANAHAQASSMYQSASDAYHSGDIGAAKAMYGLASQASAKAHELADQANTF